MEGVAELVPMRVFPKPVYHDQYMWNSRIVATTPQYNEINKIHEAAGRFLAGDLRSALTDRGVSVELI